MKKYGKNLNDIIDIKQSFFENDQMLLNDNLKISKVLVNQKERIECKNCGKTLTREFDFVKHNIPYELCGTCNQLNSLFDDTKEFANAIYVEEITDYSKTYSPENKKTWLNRMEKIYLPKAHFLREVLNIENQSDPISILDLGAGSGYFVRALKDAGFANSIGYEVSENQVKISEIMLEDSSVQQIELNDLLNIIGKTESEIITMIGVLEHLTNPREILKAISENNNIKYLYLSVPLFSYTVFFELLNQEHFNRHLSGGHTHLYTDESLAYMCKEFNFVILGKWQFGADAMDLYRLNAAKLNVMMSEKMTRIFDEKMLDILNDLQLIFDKNDFSSEVHLVLKKK